MAVAVRVARWRALGGPWASWKLDVSAWPVPVVITLAGVVLLAPPILGYGAADPFALRLAVPFGLLLLATRVLPSWRRLRILAATGVILSVPASAWLWLSTVSLGPGWLVAALPPVAYLGLTVAGVWLWRRFATATAPRVRIARPSWWVVGIAGAGGVAIWGGAWLLPASWLGRWAYQPPASSLAGWIAVVVGCAALAGAQELAFRGILLGVLEPRWGMVAVPLQALAFGLAHLSAPGATSGVGPLIPFILVVVALGIIWGWIARRTDSLLPSFAMHTVALVFLMTFVVGVA